MADLRNNPFIGLRPFQSDESIFFFGRQEQTAELLQRLHLHHFVAIVGSSGSGKSSLIKAGLIPKLMAGYLVNDRDKWIIASVQPGQSPLYNLATGILRQTTATVKHEDATNLVQKMMEEGVDALFNVLKPVWDQDNTNLFLLVDQFEELLIYYNEQTNPAKKDEVIEFVNILLELSNQKHLPVYAVITMRSDYIGDCAKFYGLPEALNQSQYLVPKLNRSQMKAAIEGPVQLLGGKIDAALTTRLLNDSRGVEDELPLLQHALMRIWDYEAHRDKNERLDLDDYNNIGGLEKALSNHADEALSGMSEDDLAITKKMFQSLTKVDEQGRKVRRRTRLSELTTLTGAPADKLMELIDRFIIGNRFFLHVYDTEKVNDKLVDISHESLIRQWTKLTQWVNDEAEAARRLMRLTESMRLHKEDKIGLLTGAELQRTWDWYEEFNPTEEWARKYCPDYSDSINYLQQSKRAHDADIKKKMRQAKNARIRTGALLGLILLGLVGFAVSQRRNADRQFVLRQNAQEAFEEADSLRAVAVRTNDQLAIALDDARKAKEEADSNAAHARRQEGIAKYNLAEASRQATLARIQKAAADAQTIKVEKLLEAFRLTAVATEEMDTDPTLALRVIEEARGIDSNRIIMNTAHRMYRKNMFYKTLENAADFIDEEGLTIVTPGDHQKLLIMPYGDSLALELRSLNGRLLKRERLDNSDFAGISISDDRSVIGVALRGTVQIIETSNLNVTHRKLNIDSTESSEFDALAVSPDMQTVVTFDYSDSSLIGWNAAGQKLFKTKCPADVLWITFDPSGKTFAVASGKNALLFSLQGRLINTLAAHTDDVNIVVFSRSGKKLVTGSSDNTAKVWDIGSSYPLTLRGHADEIISVAISPDEKLVLTMGADNGIVLWDMEGNQLEKFVAPQVDYGVVGFSADGRFAYVSSSNGVLKSWYIKGGYIKEKMLLEYGVRDKVLMAFADKQELAVVKIGRLNEARLLRIDSSWVKDYMPLGMNGTVTSVAISAMGDKMCVVYDYRNVYLWRARFELDTTRLVVGNSPVLCAAFSADGNQLAFGFRGSIVIYDLRNNNQQQVSGLQEDVITLGFNEKNGQFYAGLSDGRLLAYDLSGLLRYEYERLGAPVTAVAFSAKGDVAAGTGKGIARIWGADGSMASIAAHSQKDSVTAIAFSPNGKMLVTGSTDKTLKQWDLEGNLLQEMRSNNKGILAARFSANGDEIVSGSADGSIITWNAVKMTLNEFLRSGLADPLTPEKRKELGIR